LEQSRFLLKIGEVAKNLGGGKAIAFYIHRERLPARFLLLFSKKKILRGVSICHSKMGQKIYIECSFIYICIQMRR